jgi:hypothetical protein
MVFAGSPAGMKLPGIVGHTAYSSYLLLIPRKFSILVDKMQ